MATIFINCKVLSWGAPNEDDNNSVWAALDESIDPAEIILEDFGSVGDPVQSFQVPDQLNGYKFSFWNATDGKQALAGFPNPDPSRKLNIPKQQSNPIIYATAWYADPHGGVPGKPALVARTFDVDLNSLRKESPISSVTPNGAWPGPNSHRASTSDGAATAVPKRKLAYPAPQQDQTDAISKSFLGWITVLGPLTYPNPPIKPPTWIQEVQCTQAHSGLAVAFYGHSDSQLSSNKTVNCNDVAYDYWAEFWGKRGAEGEGPWGPHGPGAPWGPFAQRLSKLSKEDQMMLKTVMAKVKSMK